MAARLALLFCCTLLAVMNAAPDTPAADTVVLLHGLGRSPWSMKALEWSLRRAGYRVVNLGYPSRRFPIEQLAEEHLGPRLQALAPAPGTRVHFVTHSMGGIVLRCYLRRHAPPAPGRIVMLAPPNAGSEVADHLQSAWFYRFILGPAARQLGTDGLPRTLGPASAETGIIIGQAAHNYTFGRWFSGPNDGKVSVASARLEGMKDFLVVPSGHTWLMWHRPVIAQVLAFLREGRFQRSG